MPQFAKVRFKIARGSCKSPRNCPSAEQMWVKIKHCNSGLCEGVLDNEPLFLRDVSRGDSVLFHERSILQRRDSFQGLSGFLEDNRGLLIGGGALAVIGLMWWRKRLDQSIEEAGKAAAAAAEEEERRARAAQAAAAGGTTPPGT